MEVTVENRGPVNHRGRQNLLLVIPLFALLAFRLHSRGIATASSGGATMLAAGCLLLLAGLWIRVVARQWKVERSHDSLVTDGLYGYVRHPLYLGSFLLGAGLCLILGDPILLAGYVLLFWLSHGMVIRREEADLGQIFGDVYRDYRRSVPALLPAIRRRPGRVLPARLPEAITREGDSVCLWLGLPLIIQLAACCFGPGGIRGAHWYPAVLGAGIAVLALIWVRLKLSYRELITRERLARGEGVRG